MRRVKSFIEAGIGLVAMFFGALAVLAFLVAKFFAMFLGPLLRLVLTVLGTVALPVFGFLFALLPALIDYLLRGVCLWLVFGWLHQVFSFVPVLSYHQSLTVVAAYLVGRLACAGKLFDITTSRKKTKAANAQ